MPTSITDEIQPQLTVDKSARKPFVEPQVSGPVEVLESTLFFQVETGGFDVLTDITDG